MDVGAVSGTCGEGGGIDEEEEAKGELSFYYQYNLEPSHNKKECVIGNRYQCARCVDTSCSDS